MKGCMRRLALLLFFLGLLVIAWLFRDRLIAMWHDLRSDDTAQLASPELADSAERKLELMTGADAPARVSLSSAELQSLVAYRMTDALPSFVLAPEVTVQDGVVRVRARVPTDEVAGVEGIGGSEELLAMLPDTTEVEAKGHLIPLADGQVALAVDEVTAASIPLPDRYIPKILERMGRVDQTDLPNEALALRLPEGVSSVYADGDSIIFISRGASRD